MECKSLHTCNHFILKRHEKTGFYIQLRDHLEKTVKTSGIYSLHQNKEKDYYCNKVCLTMLIILAYHSARRAYAQLPTFLGQENFDVNAKLLTLILAGSMVMAYAYRLTRRCAKNCSSSEVYFTYTELHH